jgi:hypothetical protein
MYPFVHEEETIQLILRPSDGGMAIKPFDGHELMAGLENHPYLAS